MKQKIRIKRIVAFFLLVLVFFLSVGETAEAAEKTFMVDEEGVVAPISTAYEVETTWKNLGEYGNLNHAEDLFMDKNNQLYVVDTGNNRVLKMSLAGEVLAEYTEGYDLAFSGPKGVFVNTDGSIWIADTGNYRIVKLDAQGNEIGVLYKPESSLLEESFAFAPEKIYVSATGYIYVLKGSNLMLMDANNGFRGYVGASIVPFSLRRLLIRTFGTRSQMERTIKQEPSAYTNFMIASDGMIYGIMTNEVNGRIRRLNSVGTNTYPEGVYGYGIYHSDIGYLPSSLSDINVMDNGIITLCDKNTGLLYQYDQDGMLLAVFGGIGDAEGTYQNPISIVTDSNNKIYVLDYSTNAITVLKPTKFIQTIHNAVYAYDSGMYENSKEYWEQVLEMNSNYALAHQGYAKLLYMEGHYKESMAEYILGNDKEGYSKSFSEYRHEMFRTYFTVVVLIVCVIAATLWLLFVKIKKRADVLARKLEMGGWIE